MFNLAFIKENKYFVIIVLVLAIIIMYMLSSMSGSIYKFFGGESDEAGKARIEERLKHGGEINDENQKVITILKESHDSSEKIVDNVDAKEDNISDSISDIRDGLRMDSLDVKGSVTPPKPKDTAKVKKMTREKLLKSRKKMKRQKSMSKRNGISDKQAFNDIVKEYDRTEDEKKLTSSSISANNDFIVLDRRKTDKLSEKKINAIWQAYYVVSK